MSNPIRLIVQQPSLAKYRVPVFRELATHEDIDFTLLFGSRHDLTNAEPDGFDAKPVKLWHWTILGQPIFWHSAQWQSAARGKADVLLLTWNPRYLSFLPTLLRAKLNGIPVILWGHGISQRDTSLRKRLRFWMARLASALLFYNDRAADEWRAAGRDPATIFVATNSLDQEPIQRAKTAWSDPAKLEEFRKQNGLDSGPILLFVSRLYRANRLDLLLDAMPALLADFPKLQLIVIGKGDEEQHRLQGLAAEKGLLPHIRFLGAIYDEMQLAPWFLCADAFTYPTYMGLSLLHAFGYGLPVVTCDNADAHGPEIDLLRPGENGLVYRENDPASFSAAIHSVLSDPELARRLSAEATRTVEQKANLERMVGQMAEAVRYCASKVRR